MLRDFSLHSLSLSRIHYLFCQRTINSLWNVPYISYIFTPTQIRIIWETLTNSIRITRLTHHSTRNFTLIPILKSRKSRFKKFAWADTKNYHWFESGVKFWFEIYPYVMKLKVTTSRIADGQKIEYASYLLIHDLPDYQQNVPAIRNLRWFR